MDAWISELWGAMETAEWGTEPFIGAAWDLSCLAGCGLVPVGELDRRLNARLYRELRRVERRNNSRVRFPACPRNYPVCKVA